MSNEQRVIRLEPYGPADTGMEEMQLDQVDFQSELPRQQVHVKSGDEIHLLD